MKASLPPAHCRICSTPAEGKVFSTFAFWYCPLCKDEVDVMLMTTRHPKGELYGNHEDPKDIILSTPGIYSLVYNDGTTEWYEHKAGQSNVKLSGIRVVSAKRIDDRDMPSRKRLQSPPTSSKGTSDEGLSLRTVPSSEDSLPGGFAGITFSAKDLAFPSPPSSRLYRDSKGTLRYMDSGSECLQYGQVPPDDTL